VGTLKEYLKEKVGLTPLLAQEEAARCLLCLDAPCSKACPAQTDPAKFIRSIRFLNYDGAIDVIRINNPLGGICARVCPTEKYCQKGCIRAGLDRPIDIGALQRFITDYEESSSYKALEPAKEKKDRVAIIGSGPSGLTAANFLARNGYQVTIFEKHKKAGGYLTYGIPSYRLPNEVVEKEIKHTLDLGVKIVYEQEFGKDISLDSLFVEGFKAIILATGYDSPRMIPAFLNNPYVETAVDFLSRVKSCDGKVALPDNILVIGGGDVAMDVATTAKVLGVKEVTCVVREDMEHLPASKKEFNEAQEENVSVITGFNVKDVHENKVTFVGSNENITLEYQADKIVLAIGQKPSELPLNIEFVKDNLTVKNYQTEIKGLFACGDITEGDKTVVSAIKKGKEAAIEVMKFLEEKQNG